MQDNGIPSVTAELTLVPTIYDLNAVMAEVLQVADRFELEGDPGLHDYTATVWHGMIRRSANGVTPDEALADAFGGLTRELARQTAARRPAAMRLDQPR
jgi:hypothetical protein